MKTATVRELRNHYADLLNWVRAGEEIVITQKGIPVARLVPMAKNQAKVNWAESPEVSRVRTNQPKLTADQVASLLKESGGKW